MTKEEVNKRIHAIAQRVYNVDSTDPDPQQFAIEDEIEELLADLGVTYEKESD